MNVGALMMSGLAACVLAVAVGPSPARAASTLDGGFVGAFVIPQGGVLQLDVGTTIFGPTPATVFAAFGSYDGLNLQALQLQPLTFSVGSSVGFTGAFGAFNGSVTSASLSTSGAGRELNVLAFGDFSPVGTLSSFAPTRSRVTFTLNQAPIAGSVVSGTFVVVTPPPPAVPEPGVWAFMIGGLGLVGYTLRRRRALTADRRPAVPVSR